MRHLLKHRSSWIFVCTVLALLTLAALPSTSAADVEALVGKPAANFTLKTAAGESVSLSDQKGKVVLLYFWATWCPPCVKALPHVDKLAKDQAMAAKGLVVWGVNAQEAVAKVKAFQAKNNYTFTAPLDAEGKTMEAYGINGIPTQILVGADGVITHVSVVYGGEAGDAALDKAIEEALAKAGK